MFDWWLLKIEAELRRNFQGFLHFGVVSTSNPWGRSISARITETSSSKYKLMKIGGSVTGDEGGFDRQRFDFEGCPDQ